MSSNSVTLTSETTVGILMIATNEYLQMWFNAAKSIERNAFKSYSQIRIHLFTNLELEAIRWSKDNLQRINLCTHSIKGWGWPEASLLRYEIFNEKRELLNEQFLIYLDSDMEVIEDFATDLESTNWIKRLGFVQHPGFYKRKGLLGLIDVIRRPHLVKPWLKSIQHRQKGLGTWESQNLSVAFVPAKDRNIYVHGAIWFGFRKDLLQMIDLLSVKVREDLSNEIVPQWHDESYLNWYFAINGGVVFGCELSGVYSYRSLRHLRQKIVTVKKESDFGRNPTKYNLLK